MPDVTISYKGSQIASMDASGTKTLLTEGKYCEDDITVSYTRYSPNLQSKQVSPVTSQQTITADEGYDALSSVTVYAVPSYAGAHHRLIPPYYTVTVSLANPSGTAHFGQVLIYEASSDDPYQLFDTLLGTITTPTGSATVTVPFSAYGILCRFSGSWIGYGPQYATNSYTGGVSYGNGDSDVLVFSVTGDGTVTIDGVDWEEDY